MKKLALLTLLTLIGLFANAQNSFSENNGTDTSPNSITNYIHASIYPNPSNGYFSVKVKEDNPYHIAIYSMNGALVYQQENIRDGHIQIDISSLVERGFYHVRITQNENAIIKKLIIH